MSTTDQKKQRIQTVISNLRAVENDLITYFSDNNRGIFNQLFQPEQSPERLTQIINNTNITDYQLNLAYQHANIAQSTIDTYYSSPNRSRAVWTYNNQSYNMSDRRL